jgi:hypothetical protein
MKLFTLKAAVAAGALALTGTSFAHTVTTCNTTRTHYTAGYDYAPPSTVVVQQAPVVRYQPVTLVAPAVPHFRTFQPFSPGVVILD